MSQTFKNTIPKSILFCLLENICDKHEKYYIFDMVAYKKGIYMNTIPLFCEEIKAYYHDSKQVYVDRKISYSRLCTIIRQICNSNSIMFTTKILYSKSKFNIPYFIYF